MNARQRKIFDELLEHVLQSLPSHITDLLEEAPLIVEDHPSLQLLEELGINSEDVTLCGLHSGIPLTERSVTRPAQLPETIHIFREGIVQVAHGVDDRISEQIRITLLHEIGHHFGLDESDLDQLGYG